MKTTLQKNFFIMFLCMVFIFSYILTIRSADGDLLVDSHELSPILIWRPHPSSVTYEYDIYGRLIDVKDEQGKIIRHLYYDGLFLIGYDQYIYFTNNGETGEVEIEMQIKSGDVIEQDILIKCCIERDAPHVLIVGGDAVDHDYGGYRTLYVQSPHAIETDTSSSVMIFQSIHHYRNVSRILVINLSDSSDVKWEYTDIAKTEKQAPHGFQLGQNFPNPFNSATRIRFHVPHLSNVSIKLFDVLGREVRTLVEKMFERGYHSVVWDGADNSGKKNVSGIYLCRMESDNFIEIKRVMYLK